MLAVGVGRTVIFTWDETVRHGDIPVVVNVKIAFPENPEGGDHVAFNVEAFGENAPPWFDNQLPAVAEPPIKPERVAEFPWQIVWATPAFTVGGGFTVILTVDNITGHGDIPVVVNVKIAFPENPEGGDHVAFKVVAFGKNVPPWFDDHIAPIAEPPILPANKTLPPWHIVWAVPAFAVGVWFTTIVTFDTTELQGFIPVVVNVKTAFPLKFVCGVQVEDKELILPKLPPAGVDHVPPVAEPPTVPFNVILPPWQIVCGLPAFAVGNPITLIFPVIVVSPHSFVTFNVIVLFPTVKNDIFVGFCIDEFTRLPFWNVHNQLLIKPEHTFALAVGFIFPLIQIDEGITKFGSGFFFTVMICWYVAFGVHPLLTVNVTV